ncbi:ATPase inhibitor B, mitochondrial isoform X2 [Oncorhynchus tshawytscha]|uniref:ATPase inhibitor B, mitochondrial isoform X2 n=1 Tax=Oncorhynchus tshawytscha TaxID=74940 RepID=UPI000D09BD55|nr:ATPase inhibitor B, mitochondrial isoform X2 [Oncorhynchus tshawytscha]
MARFLRADVRSLLTTQLRMASDQLGELGKGAGKGGGGGGSVREAGGALGKKQAAEEEMYFRRKEQEQLAALKQHHQEEIDHHKKEISRLQNTNCTGIPPHKSLATITHPNTHTETL